MRGVNDLFLLHVYIILFIVLLDVATADLWGMPQCEVSLNKL